MQVTVLHADAAVLVLDKPAGLLSVPGRGPDKQDCLSRRVLAHYPDALVVHRLDMATSGLMLMARGSQSQTHLSKSFAARCVDKRYQALVHGPVPAQQGQWQTIDLPIAVDWPNRPRRTICAATGKDSLTRWRVLGLKDARTSWLELEPVTGRSHQLRVHLLAIGHPIVGDTLYAATGPKLMPIPLQPATRLMLHATRIRFTHPLTAAPMEFRSPAPFAAPQ